MFVKRFFYVCAGLLCLALAYHLGARSATAQGGGAIEAAEINYFYGSAPGVVVNRTIYHAVGAPPGPGTLLVAPLGGPIPGTSPVVALDPVDGAALLANGDYYKMEGGWVLKGNFLALATSATRETWGGVKVRYR